MKTKSEIIKGQLMTSKLTPLQWNGILRSMDEYAKQQSIDFAEYLSTHFVPTSQNGVLQYWQQKNYQGKVKFTTDEVYSIYVSEPTQIAQK